MSSTARAFQMKKTKNRKLAIGVPTLHLSFFHSLNYSLTHSRTLVFYISVFPFLFIDFSVFVFTVWSPKRYKAQLISTSRVAGATGPMYLSSPDATKSTTRVNPVRKLAAHQRRI